MIRKRPPTSRHRRTDSDLQKGAVESDKPRGKTNNSLPGQLPHRPKDEMINGQDTDFPEPGGNPEHSGESEEMKDAEGAAQDQAAGHRQKRKQGDRRGDTLAS